MVCSFLLDGKVQTCRHHGRETQFSSHSSQIQDFLLDSPGPTCPQQLAAHITQFSFLLKPFFLSLLLSWFNLHCPLVPSMQMEMLTKRGEGKYCKQFLTGEKQFLFSINLFNCFCKLKTAAFGKEIFLLHCYAFIFEY